MNKKKIYLFAAILCLLTALLTGIPVLSASGLGENNTTGNRQAEFTNGIYNITTGGRYVLSGEHTGQIVIRAARTDAVILVLDNFTLHNPNGPAIFAPRSQRVELILTDGTVNLITDGKHPNDEANAAIYVQNDLIISGGGVLNVSGNHQHGIRAQDFLTINSGTINITAKGDALRGRDAVIINNGTFTLTAGGDGIQSNNDSNPERGYVTINNGAFTIKAEDDGIQAETAVTINGGNFTMAVKDDGITSGGSVLITGGAIQITESLEGIEGLNVTITGGNIDIFSRDDGINAREPGIVSDPRNRFMQRRPLNENIFVRITGGNIDVHALHDGIDSNNNVFIEGGTIRISGPSMGMNGAIDFDGFMRITGGRLITAGSVISVSAQSTQPALLTAFTQQLSANSLIEVKDKNGKILLDYISKMPFYMSGFSSPDFVIGETYSVYINNEKTGDIMLSGIVTSLGNNRNSRGFGGGGRMPPMPWR